MNFTGLYVLHISSWVAHPTIRKAHEPLLRSAIGILYKAVACLHYQTRHCFAMCNNLWKHLLTKWNNIKLPKLFLSCYCTLVLSSLAASFRTLSSHVFLAFWGASSYETSFHNLFVHFVIKHPYYLHSPLIFFNTFIFTRPLSLYSLYSCTIFSRCHYFVLVQILFKGFLSQGNIFCVAVWECDHISLPQNNWSDERFVYSNPAFMADIFTFKRRQ